MYMKKIINIWVMLMIAIGSSAQTAKQVLDKTAAALSNKGGVTANFTVAGKQHFGTNIGEGTNVPSHHAPGHRMV